MLFILFMWFVIWARFVLGFVSVLQCVSWVCWLFDVLLCVCGGSCDCSFARFHMQWVRVVAVASHLVCVDVCRIGVTLVATFATHVVLNAGWFCIGFCISFAMCFLNLLIIRCFAVCAGSCVLGGLPKNARCVWLLIRLVFVLVFVSISQWVRWVVVILRFPYSIGCSRVLHNS